MDFIIEHTRIGFELPELISLILLIVVVVFFIVRMRKMKKTEDELVDEIQDLQRKESERKRARFM